MASPASSGTGARLAQEARDGSRRSLSRLLTAVESRTPAAEEALRLLYPAAGGAHVVGVTGPPGGGKSTLVAALARMTSGAKNTPLIIRADSRTPHQAVVTAMDAARQLGLLRLSIATAKPRE